jgi:hypothetical protein
MAAMRLAMTMAALVVLVLGVLLWFHPNTGATLRPMLRDLFTLQPQKVSSWMLIHRWDMFTFPERSQKVGERRRKLTRQRVESLHRYASRLSEQHPEDWRLLFATTLLEIDLRKDQTPHSEYLSHTEYLLWQIDRLYALCMRFPDRPEIAATLLRRVGQFSFRRSPSPFDMEHHQKIMARWARLAQLAERMEQVDPQNAFFPQMRACLLAGLGRKEEAFAVWQHAARKQRWDDYIFAEVEAVAHLAERLDGAHSTTLASSCLTLLLPHFAWLRQFDKDFAIPRARTLYREGRADAADALVWASARNAALVMVYSKSRFGTAGGYGLLKRTEASFAPSKTTSPQLLAWIRRLDTQWAPLVEAIRRDSWSLFQSLIEDTNRSLRLYRLASQRLAAGLILLALALSLGLMMRLRVPASVIPLLLMFLVVLPLFYWLSQCAMASNLKGVDSIEVILDASQVSTTGTPSLWERIVEWLTRFLTLNLDPIPSWTADVIVLWIGLVIITLLLILLRLWLWKRVENLWLFVQRSFFWLAIVMFLGAGAALWQYAPLERRLQSEWRELLTNETRYCAHRLGVPVPPISPLPAGY